MNSQRKSVGNICLAFLWSGVFLGLVSCTVVSKRGDGEESAEVSLSEDRQSIDELRKNIPEQKRTENDILRETLSLLGEVKDPPHRHRERFERSTRRIRQDFQKDARRERDDYNKKERKAREEFLKKLNDERDDFKDKKSDREKRKEFYDEQDARRREFFADQKDARRQFESDRRQKDNDFNSMMREKSREFYRELQNYTRSYNEMIKQKRDAAKKPVQYQQLKTEK